MLKKHKKKSYKKSHIYIPVFGTNGNIFFDREEYIKFCKKYHDFEHEYEVTSAGDCLLNDEFKEFAIGIFDNSLGTLAHELVHVVQWIMQRSHINTTDSDGETMAHIMKYMFDIIEERMDK